MIKAPVSWIGGRGHFIKGEEMSWGELSCNHINNCPIPDECSIESCNKKCRKYRPKERYPECEKLASVRPQSDVVGEFLDWLSHKKKLSLCKYYDKEDPPFIDKDTGAPSTLFSNDSMANPEFQSIGYYPYHYQIEQLLAEFFEIDLKKVEKERRQMLEDARKINER